MQRVTLGKHRVQLHATRGFPAERVRVMADVAWLAVERNVSARARLVEVAFRDQDGAYDISVGTTTAEDRTCAGRSRPPSPRSSASPLNGSVYGEDRLSGRGGLELRHLRAVAGAEDRCHRPDPVGRPYASKLAKLGASAGTRDCRRIYGPPAGRRRPRKGGVNRGSRSAATRIVDRSDREPRVGGL